MSPALAGRFLTTAPPGKSLCWGSLILIFKAFLRLTPASPSHLKPSVFAEVKSPSFGTNSLGSTPHKLCDLWPMT